MRFSPTLENSRDDSRHISRRERTLGVGVGSTINVSPDPFPSRVAPAAEPERKTCLRSIINQAGSFVPPSALSEYPARDTSPMRRHERCIERGYSINNKSVRSAKLPYTQSFGFSTRKARNKLLFFLHSTTMTNFRFSPTEIQRSTRRNKIARIKNGGV